MAQVSVRETLDVSAERLWELIADFGNVSWLPGITKVEIEGEGPGMLRILHVGDAPPVRERLESVDPESRTLVYTIPENIPFPVTGYRATVRVAESGTGSELVWGCEFEPAGVSDEQAVGMLEQMYKTMIGWVRDAAA